MTKPEFLSPLLRHLMLPDFKNGRLEAQVQASRCNPGPLAYLFTEVQEHSLGANQNQFLDL